MSAKYSLDGSMIPRSVKRIFDQRSEARIETESLTAVLTLRGQRHVVRLLNLSRAGAMVIFPEMPHIGEPVALQMLERREVDGQVRWVRDGRIGISFAAELD